jgi:predicted branched-subunit amino acid permease
MGDQRNSDFMRGFKAGLTAGVLFSVIFFNWGIYALQKGFPPLLLPVFTFLVFAAPAQYAVVDMMGASIPIWQFVLVGVMANVRFFVWGLAMSHFVKHVALRRFLPWAFFVGASTFVLPLSDKRNNPNADYFSYYKGVVVAAVPITVLGTISALAFHGNLSPTLAYASALFFPVYFAILLINDIKKKSEAICVVATFLLTPKLELMLPGWGTILSALIFTTLSVGVKAWIRQAGW